MVSQKGHKINLGRKLTEEIRAKQSVSLRGKNKGEKNGQWKGNDAGYKALHMWVNSEKGKPTAPCNKCGCIDSWRYVWANISGEYKRDINDYQSLCHKCNLNDTVRKHSRFYKG